jgi:hypothetical protein
LDESPTGAARPEIDSNGRSVRVSDKLFIKKILQKTRLFYATILTLFLPS